MAAANTSGGVLGKMVSPQNLAIAAAAVGMAGREGDIFRKVIGWSLGLLVLMCVLVGPAVHARARLDGPLTGSARQEGPHPTGCGPCTSRPGRVAVAVASVRSSTCSRPTVSPGRSPMARRPGQHARGERRPVQRVVADGEGLPQPAEHDLLVGDEAADPQPVHADAVDVGAPGPVQAGRGGVGHRRAAGLAPGGGDELRRTPRGARTARRPCRGGAARRPRRTRRTGPPAAAKRIIRIAPMEKLGAISTPVPRRVGQPAAQLARGGRRRSRWCRRRRGCRARCRTAGCPSPRRGG